MNSSYNYSDFIDMFLNSNDEFEPYGFSDDIPSSADIRQSQYNPSQHREKLIIDPGDD